MSLPAGLIRSSLLLLAAALLVAAPAAAQAPAPKTTLPDIEDEVMCPVCGTLLELAAEAPQAQRQRAFIREQIAQGKSKDEIKDELVAEFGDEVLATPGTGGFDLAAWVVPGLAIVVAAVAIVIGLRRWRRSGPGRGGDGGDDAKPLDQGEAERLDEDLARYEL